MTRYIIGIDEVGRGPLAGPVCVGAVCATPRIIKKYSLIKESKQLSQKKREEWSLKILSELSDDLKAELAFIDSKTIDKIGISKAIKEAIFESIEKLNIDCNKCHVKLDGGLKAPEKYKSQETIIRGDANETIIAMASVVAKVARDNYMVSIDSRYKKYNFRKHKGYGTKEHINAIKKHGLSKEHRKSFCKNFI